MPRKGSLAHSHYHMLRHHTLYPIFIVALVATLLIWILGGALVYFFVVVILATGIMAWGVFDIRLGYFTDTFFRKKNTAKGLIALSFDDGPSRYTAQVLQMLNDYQFKATFFCVGKQILEYPDVAKRIVEEGHTIGNHTYHHHTHFGFLGKDDVVAEIEECNAMMRKIVGVTPKLFRPPFGVTNPSVAKAVQYKKMQVIGWSNRSLDTVTKEEDKIYKRVCRKLKSGDIILFHDTSKRTVHVLKRLLPYLQKQGYISVSVDDLLNLNAYEQ